MNHPIHRVTCFEKVAPHTLTVWFDDGVSQTIDFQPVLKGDLYGPLQDEELFDQVRLDPEVHTLVWPNAADFDPATLHGWPQVAEEMEAMASRWGTTATEPSGHSG